PTTSAARIAASFLVPVIQQAIFLLVSRRRTYHATEPNVQDSSSEALYLTRDARLAESLGQMVDLGPIEEGQPSNMLGKGVCRIEIQRRVRISRGSVEVRFPQVEDRGDVMHEGNLRTLPQSQVDMALGPLERLAPVIGPMELPVQNLRHREAGIGLAITRI